MATLPLIPTVECTPTRSEALTRGWTSRGLTSRLTPHGAHCGTQRLEARERGLGVQVTKLGRLDGDTCRACLEARFGAIGPVPQVVIINGKDIHAPPQSSRVRLGHSSVQ